jgi:hypothetical protein
MKKIFVLLCLALLAACSQNKNNMYVAQIDGMNIEPKEYHHFVRRQYNMFRTENDRLPTGDEIDLMEIKAWDDMLKAYVLKQLYTEYAVNVTPQECVDSLLANPPAYLKYSKKFNVDNEFQQDTYESSIVNDEPYDMNWVKQYYLLTYLPFQKLKKAVIRKESVSPEAIRKYYDEKYSTADLDLIKLENLAIETPNILPSDINKYYESNKNDYRVNAWIKADYVIFPLVPGKVEDKLAKAKIDSIYRLIKKDHDFAYLARKHSMAESAKYSGNAGFVDLKSIPVVVRNKWKKNDYTEISRPFRTEKGWVIYKPIRKTKSMIKVSEIVIKPDFSESSKKRLLEKILDLRETSKELGLAKAAYEFDLKSISADSVSILKPEFPKIGANKALFERLLKTKANELTEPIFIDELSSYVLVQSKKIQKNGYKSLFEVSEEISDKILELKTEEALYRKAVETCKNMTPEVLAQGLANGKYHMQHFDSFTINTAFEGEVSEKGNLALLKAESGILPYPARFNDRLYLVRKNIGYPAPSEMFETHKAKIHDEMLNDTDSEYFTDWLKNKIDSLKVKDWRQKNSDTELEG